MKEFLLISKVNLLSKFGLNKIITKGCEDRKKALLKLLLIIFVTVMIEVSAFSMFYPICELTHSVGSGAVVLTYGVAAASVFTLFTALFSDTAILFAYKDYDFLMSSPVKTRTVLATRFSALYFMELLFAAAILLPAIVAYGVVTSPTVMVYIRFVFALLVVPLVPMVLGFIPGVLLSLIASRLKHKEIIRSVFGIALLLAYFVFIYSTDASTMTDGNAISKLGSSISSIYFLSGWFVNGTVNGNLIEFALFILINVAAVSAAFAFILWKYAALKELIASRGSEKEYRITDKSFKQSSAFSALLRIETRRYLGTPVYVMNTVFGYVLMLFGSVAALVFRGSVNSMLAESVPSSFLDVVELAVACVLCSFISISATTSSAISIEGKEVWVTKTLPVGCMTIFKAKMALNLYMAIPTSIISSTLLAFAFNVTGINIVLLYIMPIAAAFLFSVFGLYINLLLPKLDWTNPAQPVKQSACVLIVNMGGMLLFAVPIVVMASVKIDGAFLCWLLTAAVIAITAMLYNSLRTHGDRWLLRLGE